MEKFVNPYNFISLPAKKASAYKRDNSRTLTGRIQYEITTKSPLFIPNTSTDEAFAQSQWMKEHKSYDFFSYRELLPYANTNQNPKPEEPVIPGSEIRGVIRSVYETLTDSCMGVLNSETMPVKRSPEQFEPGLIGRNEQGFLLKSAQSYRIGKAAPKDMAPPNFRENRNGTKIFFRDPGISKQKQKNKYKIWKKCITEYRISQDSEEAAQLSEMTGYLIKWGMGVRKKRYHVFVPEDDIASGLSREDIETKLLGVIKSYLDQPLMQKDSQKENKEAYEEYENDLKHFLQNVDGQGTYFPVTYSVLGNGNIHIQPAAGEEESKWYLAPALYTKEISNNKIGTLAGEFAPCQEGQECPACALFGHVDASGTGSRGSKIRFSDLRVKEKKPLYQYYYPITILPILAEPKLGNVEFYLKKPENASFWTYDYYYRYRENGTGTDLVEKPGELRGRKYYWHHPEYCRNNSKKLPKDRPRLLNKTVRPLKQGVTFIGELYFGDISEKQLKQLVWILNAGTEAIGYKLGAAKPFGFGSITCRVLGVTERRISVENGQIIYKKNDNMADKYLNVSYEDAEFSEHCKEQFYRIAGLYSVESGMEVTYPKTRKQMQKGDNGEGFRWFSENHANISGEGMPRERAQRKIRVALPSLEDAEIGLPYDISDADL